MRYGLSARCGKVRASNVPVLELERPRFDGAGDDFRRDRLGAAP